uniref:Uncharacterized protein n=1 Tax=Mastacembelus armatus TaxID=205130 RepID=A0A3Q3LHJ5_9TELE
MNLFGSFPCHSQPKSSLVFAARCLSINTTVVFFSSVPTCFSTSRMVSLECPSFAFLTCVMALERTFLSESLALLLNCLASLVRFSLCSLFLCFYGCMYDRLTSGKLLIWLRGNFPSSVVTTMLRVKSSLSVLRMVVISSFTSSRLMMSSTRDELIFTLAACPFALAWRTKTGK